MSVVENWIICRDVILHIDGMRQDMLAGAEHVKAMLADGEDMTEILRVMHGNASGFKRRAEFQEAIEDNPQKAAKLHEGLKGFGINNVDALKDEMRALKDVAESMALADATTVGAKADEVLANVPVYERLF